MKKFESCTDYNCCSMPNSSFFSVKILHFLVSVYRKKLSPICCKLIQSRNVEFLLFLRNIEELFCGRFIG